jgi:hypothetical protein
LALGVLTESALADYERKCEERERWFWEYGSHGLTLQSINLDVNSCSKIRSEPQMAALNGRRDAATPQLGQIRRSRNDAINSAREGVKAIGLVRPG